MTTKQLLMFVAALVLGALARDLFTPRARAQAEEDALRRPDVVAIVRALEAQARAAERQVEATRELARNVHDTARCR